MNRLALLLALVACACCAAPPASSDAPAECTTELRPDFCPAALEMLFSCSAKIEKPAERQCMQASSDGRVWCCDRCPHGHGYTQGDCAEEGEL